MSGFKAGVHEKGPPPTDFENPVRDGNTPDGRPHYRVTVCDDNTPGEWKIHPGEASVHVEHVRGSDRTTPAPPHGQSNDTKGIAKKDSVGSDGSVDIGGHALKQDVDEASSDFDITVTLENGDPVIRVRLTIRVVHCPKGHGPVGLPVPNPARG
jgi:hypothetical protein